MNKYKPQWYSLGDFGSAFKSMAMNTPKGSYVQGLSLMIDGSWMPAVMYFQEGIWFDPEKKEWIDEAEKNLSPLLSSLLKILESELRSVTERPGLLIQTDDRNDNTAAYGYQQSIRYVKVAIEDFKKMSL